MGKTKHTLSTFAITVAIVLLCNWVITKILRTVKSSDEEGIIRIRENQKPEPEIRRYQGHGECL